MIFSMASGASVYAIGSRRRTFFYLFEDYPPFAILAVTPRLTFFNATVEYATGLVRHAADELVVSMGVEDCYSRYVRVSLCAQVLRRLHWREPFKRDHARERAICSGTARPEKSARPEPR